MFQRKRVWYAIGVLYAVILGMSVIAIRQLMLDSAPTTIEIVEYDKRPAWIFDVAANIDLNIHQQEWARRTLCVGINERALLIMGVEDGAFERGEFISFSTRLTVDGSEMPFDASTNRLAIWVREFTPEGVPIGSHSRFTSSCFGVDSARKGAHSAEFAVITALGTEYTYDWDFRAE